MNEEFEIPVVYNNQQMNFSARLLTYAYSYKIEVDINGTRVLFEPDEERSWRALIAYEELAANKNINRDLLQAVSDSIEQILK